MILMAFQRMLFIVLALERTLQTEDGLPLETEDGRRIETEDLE